MSATFLATAATVCAAQPAGPDVALVVEDDAAIGGLMTLMLAAHVPRVVHVRSNAACLDWFAGHAPSVRFVVMDCSLPDGPGGVLARRLRLQRPGLPLLLMSGRQQPDAVRQLAADGPVDFLPKPFRTRELAERVHRLLAAPAAA